MAASSSAAAAAAAAEPHAVVPITRVVLFKHGIAYVERVGAVENNVRMELLFRASEMNDMLKSLTVLDLDGGAIASISYAASVSRASALRVPVGDALLGLLEQLGGARVRVSTAAAAGDVVEGVIVGVQRALVAPVVLPGMARGASADGDSVSPLLLLLVGGKTVQGFELRKITSLELCDESLQRELQHLLETSFDSKKSDMKKVTIFGNGAGKRRLLVAYAVECPVWKTSYRILLHSASGEEPKSHIQGWAVVDNTQDEDWTGVELVLVSGLPISFVHDLYTPRLKRRPTVRVEEEEAYAPPVVQSGYSQKRIHREGAAFGGDDDEKEKCDEDYDSSASSDGSSSSSAGARRGGARSERRVSDGLDVLAGKLAPSAIAAARKRNVPVQTRTAEVGDLFEYEIAERVTVKRNQSALVPIVHTAIEARRVALYNASVRDKNPMTSLHVRNTTGLTLEGGPLTVLQDEKYVGEAMLETMKAGEERFLPYSVELGCRVRTEDDQRSGSVHRSRIVGGALITESFQFHIRHYVAENSGAAALELYVDHPRRAGAALVDTPAPHETTDNYHRFRVMVGAKSAHRLTVCEQSAVSSSFSISSVNTSKVEVWFSSKLITPEIRARLLVLLDLKSQEAAANAEESRIKKQHKALVEENGRLRENVRAMGSSSKETEMKNRYLERLERLERDLDANVDARRAAEQTLVRLAGAVREQLATLQMDIPVEAHASA